jgi:hypothetical protein
MTAMARRRHIVFTKIRAGVKIVARLLHCIISVHERSHFFPAFVAVQPRYEKNTIKGTACRNARSVKRGRLMWKCSREIGRRVVVNPTYLALSLPNRVFTCTTFGIFLHKYDAHLCPRSITFSKPRFRQCSDLYQPVISFPHSIFHA